MAIMAVRIANLEELLPREKQPPAPAAASPQPPAEQKNP
jgi:hypothetical protein